MKNKIFERVNNNNCPICNKKLDEDISFIDYNGKKQPVHTNHIKFQEKL